MVKNFIITFQNIFIVLLNTSMSESSHLHWPEKKHQQLIIHLSYMHNKTVYIFVIWYIVEQELVHELQAKKKSQTPQSVYLELRVPQK